MIREGSRYPVGLEVGWRIRFKDVIKEEATSPVSDHPRDALLTELFCGQVVAS